MKEPLVKIKLVHLYVIRQNNDIISCSITIFRRNIWQPCINSPLQEGDFANSFIHEQETVNVDTYTCQAYVIIQYLTYQYTIIDFFSTSVFLRVAKQMKFLFFELPHCLSTRLLHKYTRLEPEISRGEYFTAKVEQSERCNIVVVSPILLIACHTYIRLL